MAITKTNLEHWRKVTAAGIAPLAAWLEQQSQGQACAPAALLSQPATSTVAKLPPCTSASPARAAHPSMSERMELAALQVETSPCVASDTFVLVTAQPLAFTDRCQGLQPLSS